MMTRPGHITDIPNLVPVPAGILVRTGLRMAYGAMPGRRDGHVDYQRPLTRPRTTPLATSQLPRLDTRHVVI